MATQYTIGIEHLIESEILQLSPKRLTQKALQSMSNARLVALRNVEQVATNYYQNPAHGRRLFDRLQRLDAEIERRGLRAWMETPCTVCGEKKDLGIAGDYELLHGECACTRALNTPDWPRMVSPAVAEVR